MTLGGLIEILRTAMMILGCLIENLRATTRLSQNIA
jgi:hypothetical protein